MPTTRISRTPVETTYAGRPPLTTKWYFLQDTEWNFILDTEWHNIQVIGEPYAQDTQREWRPAI